MRADNRTQIATADRPVASGVWRELAVEVGGDRIRVRLTCKEKSLRPDKGYGEVRWDAEIVNQNGEPVAQYDVLTMVSEREIPDAT